ncbi:putative Helicase/Exonuclease [Oceanicola granulosus HTCC2516]|uniref:Putative Helicase/Exonuclease n=1 Tax=Oceanicola granulosus (strain ATCC BAA-861 / DSM 15982 / KCTC 12143 / HTCC2516) TaxID=314256 RepID=Q2CJW6_OCEGH|nr:PD-(D/E)XK nuclease family protein [Oceanicola granulosus]EAR53023.1 putative Helicase/Exonuclease [Oceanicola granulosus HTCC2516]
MFAPASRPRVFALPPGVDFGAELVRGLRQRSADLAPDALARVELFVNTRRMQRRLREVYDGGPPTLLPRLRLVTDLALDPKAGLPPPVPPLERRFEILRLVGALLESDPSLAPRAALFDLSDSLAGLLDEMQGEGVDPEALHALEGTDQSEHWQRTLAFVRVVERYFDAAGGTPDREARQRRVAEGLAERWGAQPPAHPLIVAGSTGSRGATGLFMEAVARLPQGALVLPGFDFDMPAAVWRGMGDGLTAEDHPQFRFKRLLDRLEILPRDVEPWTDTGPASPARNRLVSLSLRPAPVTDAWLTEGPALGDMRAATAGLTLVEAPTPRAEAETIALAMRQAVEDGRTVALITPDRMLTRQVSAALDRWDITPDDSAGQPLPQSPPGRFLRHVAALISERVTGETLLSLLKHPLCHSGGDRGPHLLATRELELHLRRHGPPFPTAESLRGWGGGHRNPERTPWAEWLAGVLETIPQPAERPLADHLGAHMAIAEALAAGPDGGAGELWDEAAGRKALEIRAALEASAGAAGVLTTRNYVDLFTGVLNGAEVRNPTAGHPLVQIRGTLESRVQGADIVILGGLNEGTWPEVPAPDPWLNRTMRHRVGLLLPERRIGLSAHDYQQAIAGPEVWLTRARRSDEAGTVPSRWLNRLTNLLEGLTTTHGPEALAAMRARGAAVVAQAAAIVRAPDRIEPAPRPSPAPPVAARPRQLSVTQIQRLIRNPFHIYARKVLRLQALDPLVPGPDALMRGNILHAALEAFVEADVDPSLPWARRTLLAKTEEALADACPWPAHRRLWFARMERVADWFLETEAERRRRGRPAHLEVSGEITLHDLELTLRGKADRIDLTPEGRAILYDYKTGTPPSQPQQEKFDKQLLLEAAMIARGAFEGLGRLVAADAQFIGLGAKPAIVSAPLDAAPPDVVWEEFRELIRAWRTPTKGYSSWAFPFSERDRDDYDHLARRGEWDPSTPFTKEVLS